MKYKIFLIVLFSITTVLDSTAESKIKTSDAYIYSLKQKINRYTNDFISYLNKLIISSGNNEIQQGDKKEIIYDANKLFLRKADNDGVDIYFENLFDGIGIPKRTTGYTSMELLEQFSVLKKYKNMSLSSDELRVSDMYLNSTNNTYLIKASFILIASVADDEDDAEVYNKEIDIIFTSNKEGTFKISMLNASNNSFPGGFTKVVPTSEKEDIPGVAFVFDVSPIDSKIVIDNKEYENIQGEKILTEKGVHTILILPPNDNYEEADVITKRVVTDTGTVFIKKQLRLKKGVLILSAGNDCMNGVQADIYRMNEEIGYKGVGKNKKEVTKLVKEKSPIQMVSIPANVELQPGNYKLVVGKYGYKTKKMNISIAPNFNTTRDITLKDLSSIMGGISDAACMMLCPKGGNCCCCSGGGKCRICKGTGYRDCHCCSGKGSFFDYGVNKSCSTCSGSGKIVCNSCRGSGRCTACKGSGRN